MTYEEKVDFLRLYTDNTTRLQGLASEVEKWQQIAQSIGVKLDDMPRGSGTGDKMSNAATNAVELIKQIETEMETARAEREMVKAVIEKQPRRKRLLLEYRYINGKTVSEIANEIGKSDKWVRQMLRNIVENMEL